MPTEDRNKRPRLDDILSGGSDDFDALWNETDAAGDDGPLPAGTYRCLVVNGELSQSRGKQTPSYKLTCEVIEPAPFAGRRIWHDLWLTPKALPTAKRDLAKLGITRPAQMNAPLRSGIVIEAKLTTRTEDDGRTFNRVRDFQVVADGPPPGALDPDEDDDARGVPF
jgi:hypothetical protein